MQRNHTKQLARKIMSLLLAGVFFADTAIFAEAPILPDQRAPGNRQPLVQETENGIPLVNMAIWLLLLQVVYLAMIMTASMYQKKGSF